MKTRFVRDSSGEIVACASSWAAPLECFVCKRGIDGLAVAMGLTWHDEEGERQAARRWAHRPCLPSYGAPPEAERPLGSHHKDLDA
jgi:hypothetical protein